MHGLARPERNFWLVGHFFNKVSSSVSRGQILVVFVNFSCLCKPLHFDSLSAAVSNFTLLTGWSKVFVLTWALSILSVCVCLFVLRLKPLPIVVKFGMNILGEKAEQRICISLPLQNVGHFVGHFRSSCQTPWPILIIMDAIFNLPVKM